MTAIIDLRSDTVTKPSPAMRRAMAEAEVGDDVFEDDPTINRLEAVAAERVGKERALFVASGTMANLVSVMTHTRAGDEILLGDESHIFNYEVAGSARVAGVQAHALPNLADGTLDVKTIAAAIRGPNIHAPRDVLLCLENTHNRCGGAAISLAAMNGMTDAARDGGLSVHLDGARLFNAAIALGVEPAAVAVQCGSVSFCLSKGLGCPVGSLICGSSDFIAEARRNRKMLGGGMRQAGILAAAGIYALEHNVDRLAQDHENAARLAEGLNKLGVFRVPPPQTNIVVVDVLEGSLEAWIERLREAGVLVVPFGAERMRLVTHLDVDAAAIAEALDRVSRLAGAVAA